MKNELRVPLLLALCAMALMLLTNRLLQPEAAQTMSSGLIAERDGLRLYAGEQPPTGTDTVYDRETLFQGLLLYVSEDAPLPDGLPVQQSRDVRGMVGTYLPAEAHVSLSEDTIYALCDLAAAHSLLDIRIAAGMRSPREQQELQRQAFETYQASLPVAEALARARKDVPDSGRSEHQLATAFDLRLTGMYTWAESDPMARTEDGRWLLEYAWRFGFIRRYPPEKSDVTGVTGEAAHWRYVGREYAAAMRAGDCCLEEYFDLLHAYGTLRLTDENGGDTWFLCQPLTGNGASFPMPEGWRASVSADNLGYAVCVLTRDQPS